MPKIADNFFAANSSKLGTPSKRGSSGDRNGSGDLFQKILNESRPQPTEHAESANKGSHSEKTAARSRRAESSGRKKRAQEEDPQPVEQAEETNEMSAETDTAAEMDIAQVAETGDIDSTEAPKPTSDIEADQQERTPDALAAAVAAGPQAMPVVADAEAEPKREDMIATEDAALLDPAPVAKPVAKELEAGTDPTARAKVDQLNEADPVKTAADASFEPPAGSEADAGDSEDMPDSQLQDVLKDAKLHAERPRKVAGLGASAPTAQSTPERRADQPADSQEAMSSILAAAEMVSQMADPAADAASPSDPAGKSPVSGVSSDANPLLNAPQPQAANKTDAAANLKAPAAPPPVAPEAEFGETNHDRIVTSVRTQLMPNGGTMKIRLDPPELGVLQVTVRMQDGVMAASFETSNDQATKLLSHSLGQLKHVLESQGVSVEKLHVQQTPKDQQANAGNEDRQQQSAQQDGQSSTRQEQQRREMLERMWRRLGIGSDPLDMVA